MDTIIPAPYRSSKPRTAGITHVIDTGMSARQAEDMLSVAADHVDIVKLGWGTSCVTGDLDRKLAVYRDAGIPVMCGGTLVEAAILHGRLDILLGEIERMGMTHVEVSDGTIDLERADKLALIERLARDFVVLSEVGSKSADVEIPVEDWVAWAREEAAAGSWKVITEARESGSVGIYDPAGAARTGIVFELVRELGAERLLFEAPRKAQQVWFIEQFGPEVNLGNIAPAEVISLETLRRGLRGDTLALAQGWLEAAADVASSGNATG